MRVLVATPDTDGEVPGDYDFCIEGELVYAGPLRQGPSRS